MATIDDKVVAMSFESSKFESGVNHAISALEKLKSALNFPTAGKGLDDISRAAKGVDLGPIARGIEGIKGALETLRLVAIGVLSQLATQAVRAGAAFVKSFTLDPIKAGFAEYSTNLNAIQTILANTQAAGENLKTVNAALKELNDYSDKTIYNFSQMAKNIGTFTAAGVDLQTATGAIKGIANLAALSGSNAEQASTAMYQLSQAIAAGSVKLQDWNSVVNAGMGGTVFQRALAQTAEAMGTLEKGAVTLEGPMKNVSIHGEAFRQSLSTPGKASWLTSDVLTKTLKQFTGDLNDAELAAMGFTKAQIASIQQTAKTAMHAATEVKTIAQVFDVAKETAGSGWAQTFQIIFGTFTEAKTTFTALSNAINGFITASSDARNKVLADWKALGGRTVLIDSIKTAFHNLGLIIAPIKEAFRDIFPAKTGRDLYNLTLQFQKFAEALRPSEQTIENLKRTFRGLFALWSIGYQIIGGIISVFARLIGVLGDGSGGFLEFTGSIGDFIVKIDEALKKGDRIGKFFDGLGAILAVPVKMLQELASALGNLFGGFSSGGFSGQMGDMTKAMNPFHAILVEIGKIGPKVLSLIQEIGKALKPAFDAYIQILHGLGTAIGEAASNMNFEAILAVIRTGLFVGLVAMFKQFLGKGSLITQLLGGLQGISGGILGSIAGSFRALEGSMVAMQNNIKAKTLKEIAIAVALLTASVVALSFIDAEGLKKGITAIGFMMGELLAAMAIMDKISKGAGFLKLPIIAAGLTALAIAIDVLTIAVFALSRLSWNELIKGLGGVGALLIGITAAAGPLSASSVGLIRAGIGITAIAIALNLMALAVRQMGSMDLGALAKGLGGVAVALGTLIAATNKMSKGGMIGTGIGLMAVAAALLIMSKAVASFGAMDLMTMVKGLAGVGAALVIIGLSMRLMPNMIRTGAGLVIVAGALNLIVKAIASMGGMSIEQIAKGLGTLAASLIILGVAMAAMSGMLAGAAALAIVATGITLLAGALTKMGGMSWGSMLKSLIMLAGALTIIGIAGALITPAIPSLLGLGAALLLIGAGLALAGAGIFLFSAGLSALLVALPTGVGIILAAIKELQKGLIENAKLLALGILEIVRAFAATAPKFVDAIVKILNSIVDGIIQIMPKLEELTNALIDTLLRVLQQNQGRIIQAGFDLLIALLQGIKNNIPALVTLVIDIVENFLRTIANNLGRIVNAGIQLLGKFIEGVLKNITLVYTTVLTIITNFLTAVAGNLGRIVTAGLSILTSLLKGIVSRIGDLIKVGADLIVAFIKGIDSAAERIVRAAREAAGSFINTLATEIVKLADEVFNAMIKLMNGLAAVIRARAPEMRAAAINVGAAIIEGLTAGVIGAAGDLYAKISGVMDHAMSLIHKIPVIGSPSKVTTQVGEWIIEGLIKGMQKTEKPLYSTAEDISYLLIGKFNEVFQTYSPSKVMYDIGQYVGQGFAEGLRGSQQDINSVWTELNQKLTEAMRTARETIIEEQAKLDELRASKKPDMKAIQEAQKVIAENESILARSKAAHTALTVALRDEKAELIGLVTDYQKVSEKLKSAQEALASAKQTRADAIKGFTDQYSTLPDIVKQDAEGNAVDQLKTYMDALKNQADAVAAYRTTLDQLRKLGLDDATYQKLLSEGTADQEFATALLAGGKTAVQGLNTLDAQLEKQAKILATHGGKNLYDTGVAAAAGLVKGLTSQKQRLIDEVNAMADEIIAAFNKRLKVKSPSQVFMEIGGYLMQGLAIGISKSAKNVVEAVDNAATAAMDAMKSSMSKVSEMVTNELNPNPIITPVLDLTQVRAQAGELGALTNVTPITAAASYGQASRISAEQAAAQTDDVVAAGLGGTSVKFEQNNYSPESLTEIEIYRQTKNQLSQLKSALSLS